MMTVMNGAYLAQLQIEVLSKPTSEKERQREVERVRVRE